MMDLAYVNLDVPVRLTKLCRIVESADDIVVACEKAGQTIYKHEVALSEQWKKPVYIHRMRSTILTIREEDSNRRSYVAVTDVVFKAL